MEKGVQTETEQSPTPAHVGDIQSTPGEDETMKELYERPSQSPPTEIDQDQLPVASEESNSLDHVENIDEVITGGQRLELSTSFTNDLREKEIQTIRSRRRRG